jgi:Protein of unknown function (DUF1176)
MMALRYLTLVAGVALTPLIATDAEAADTLPDNLLAVHQQTIDNQECQPLDGLLPYYSPIVATLSAGDTLYIIPCDIGIINTPWRVYLVSTGSHAGVHPLAFSQFDHNFGWIADSVQFNVSFDAKTKTLEAREYFDPGADCGADGTWMWKGHAFALLTYRYQSACDNTKTFKTWPTVWQLPADAAAQAQDNAAPDFYEGPP